jgi:ornithine--oxo-acid transaminase
MTIDLEKLMADHQGQNHQLFSGYINPQLARVLKTIGFDRSYVRAEGQYLYDEKGDRYLDGLGGYGVFNIGRNHPKLKKVLKQCLDMDLASMVQMDSPLLAGLLAKELVQLAPEGLDTVFFTNSGTESVEGALKFARKATGRDKILFLDHSFHGLTLGSMSVNGNKEFCHGFGALLPGKAVLQNDLVSVEKELKTKEYAAFIVEPIQGKGVHIPDDNFLPEAERLCCKYKTLFIVDEVQTGFGRTGKMFASEYWNLTPDIMCVAKSLSGGFIPVGAILYRREIYKKVFSSMENCVVHSNTFGRNSLAMAAGLATLKILEEENIVANAERCGQLLLQKLNPLVDKYEMFKAARIRGLMIGLEFGPPRSMKLKVGWKMIHAANKGLFGQMIVVPLMTEHRILSQVAGHDVDIVKLLPPLVLTDEDIDHCVTSFDRVIAECHRFPGGAWDVGKQLAKQALSSQKQPSEVSAYGS